MKHTSCCVQKCWNWPKKSCENAEMFWKSKCSGRNDFTSLWRKRLIHRVLTDNVYRLELIHPVDFYWKSWFSDSINKLLVFDGLWSFNLLESKLGTICIRNDNISLWVQKSVFEGISSSIKVRGRSQTTLTRRDG